jgi:hypothetical protein
MHVGVWITVGVLAVALAVVLVFFRGSSSKELGTLSNEWIAQHRASWD